jgi:geranyl-CoA carboxylase alpha subunit
MSKATPFTKILIANRGEIALRIMHSARVLGYATVSVYSDADRHARHVRAADQAVRVGEALPAQSYLRIDAIIEAARISGADAIHPGYGFLAENPALARACMEAGLVFIGPSAEAIEAMGHKAGAKRLMQEAGVSCVPGYQGDQDEDLLCREAERIGFPIMIKATAGGGGRGMRQVDDPAAFVEALRGARSEAQSAFGDGEVILERAIVEPHHVEIQVFADRHGSAIHLGERDCSVQRRHQKLLEEAPSPAVDEALREHMGDTAVRAAKAIGYEGAGTLEFLLDRDGNYYFMEMNTRLQVEHPVTEAITGLDLVELQLRIAAGEALPLKQEDVRFRGHAIEARLCAESPRQGFMPQSGTMQAWHIPAGARAEEALEAGSPVLPFYDSMIAKLICHGVSRDEARRRLVLVMEGVVALGVETNQDFLARCLRHPEFSAGEATTAFINEHSEELLREDTDREKRAEALAAALLYGEVCPLGMRMPVLLHFALDGYECKLSVTGLASGRLAIDGAAGQTGVDDLSMSAGYVRFTIEGLSESAWLVRCGERIWFRYRGRGYALEDHTHQAATRGNNNGGENTVKASMTGRVVAVHVVEGDRVDSGQSLLTLEAMKMEHVHTAGVAGTVSALTAVEGDQVVTGRTLVEISPLEGEDNE